jgi:hypothetical protein
MIISHQEQPSPREHCDGRRCLSDVAKGAATSNGVRKTAEHLLMRPPSGNPSALWMGYPQFTAVSGHGNVTFPPRVVTHRSPLCQCVNTSHSRRPRISLSHGHVLATDNSKAA